MSNEQFTILTATDGRIKYGYKATDANMRCRNVQFRLGEWATPVEGELAPCMNGYHFCLSIAGCLTYYSDPNARVFLVEVEDVDYPVTGRGATVKYVCRNVKFLREVTLSDAHRDHGNGNSGRCNHGNDNSGSYNAGNRNAGDKNFGNHNVGSGNTGTGNVGDGNSGLGNSGCRNTGANNIGSYNTGDLNIGNRNIGNRNIGNRNIGVNNIGHTNIGHCNNGDLNVGNHNTGDGNICSYANGCFCTEEDNFRCFDGPTGMTRIQFSSRYGHLVSSLVAKLVRLKYGLPESSPEFEAYLSLPNITKEKFDNLIQLHLAAKGVPYG